MPSYLIPKVDRKKEDGTEAEVAAATATAPESSKKDGTKDPNPNGNNNDKISSSGTPPKKGQARGQHPGGRGGNRTVATEGERSGIRPGPTRRPRHQKENTLIAAGVAAAAAVVASKHHKDGHEASEKAKREMERHDHEPKHGALDERRRGRRHEDPAGTHRRRVRPADRPRARRSGHSGCRSIP